MIIAAISGGLGNQMFQYAMAQALARRYGAEIRVDLSWFSSYQFHQGFELESVFGVQLLRGNEADYRRVLGQRGGGLFRGLMRSRWLGFLRPPRYVTEPHFHYWRGVEQLAPPVYVSGYWQSEKYFKSIAESIRRDFQFTKPLTGVNQSLAQRIANCNAVSLHIRRGDYAANSRVNATHGLLTTNYYQHAVQYVSERAKCPVFFIFSDDIEWARANLRLPFPCEFVGHNRGWDSYIDMELMSLCRHHVIANSSFSWWGAWLNARADKIVVCPNRWFRRSDLSIKDLFPAEWHVIDG